MKSRKRIRSMSTKRALEMQDYRVLKIMFLVNNPWCFVCGRPIMPRKRTLHHFFGRVGALLCWVPGFRMACMPCHNWIETHRNDSVQMGFRAPDNLFNRPSLVISRDVHTERTPALARRLKDRIAKAMK